MGMFLRRGIMPRIYDKAEGSIIKLPESGTLVEFYIAKHNYEAALNGAGQTLVVRKDCYDNRARNSKNNNNWATNSILTWLNNSYFGTLGADVQPFVGPTSYYYTDKNSTNSPVSTMQSKIFFLSLTELGLEDPDEASYANVEGTTLPIAQILRIAHLNGAANTQWTRTSYKLNVNTSYSISRAGTVEKGNTTGSNGSRPCFTLPGDMILTDDMLT